MDENGQNRFLVEIGRVGGLHKIEALQTHKSEKVSGKVAQIISDYLPYEE